MTQRLITSITATALGLSACSKSGIERDPGLQGLAVVDIQPRTAVPGTRFAVDGHSFVDANWGVTTVVIDGTIDGSSVTLRAPGEFVDYDRLAFDVGDDLLAQLGGSFGDFTGTVTVEVVSAVDGETYAADPLDVSLGFREVLEPTVTGVDSDALIFVNDKIGVRGDGFLLSEGEGETVAVVTGCFVDPEIGPDCVDVAGAEVPLVPDSPFDRTTASFAFHPAIAGIKPGSFEGEVLIRNRQPSATTESAPHAVAYDLTEPTVFQVAPARASLGQFVDITGGGFLGGDDGGLTLLELSGTFTPDGSTDAIPTNLVLIPEFIEGREIRYVINEDDALGQAIDLRRITGTFAGEVTPVTSYEGVEVRGSSGTFDLGIAPVKQVVYLVFKPSYVESLRHFGLRALDAQIRERIRQVVERDYETVNLEVRLEEPEDFSLYSEVEIAGPDPNGLGLLGYDNTPGKDTGNVRLFDRIGGVNATTQEDGFPGFGGVFIESLFAFSEHPGSFADPVGETSGAFDDIFDPFRPDRDGQPVSGADLGGGLSMLTSGDACPAGDRQTRIQCAVWVLGSLIGTTLSHEIGHSLGLANPFGEGFHNSSDEINRLMDSGGDRPFVERAELFGEGPARFCVTEYDYLRQILPTSDPADTSERPTCF
jgi:hypothetical protein